MSIVQRVHRYSQYRQDAPRTWQLLSATQRLWSQVKSGLRSFLSQLSSESSEKRVDRPASIRCTETVEYDTVVGRRIDYLPQDVVGKIEVRVPYTAEYIPWKRSRALKDQTPIKFGFLGLAHYAEAGLLLEGSLEELPHRDLYPDRFLVPLRLTPENLANHLAMGDEAVLEFTYQPQLSVEFPVSVEAELTDVPLLKDDEISFANIPTTFLEDLRLRITIFGTMSNLSQEVEQGIIEWVKEEYQRVREEANTWRQIVDALEGQGEQAPGAIKQVAQTIGGRHKVSQDILQKVERDTEPSVSEARSALRENEDLLGCIRIVQKNLGSVEGMLGTEDIEEAIRRVRQERKGALTKRSDAWLNDLQQQVRLGTTNLRYIGVEWPLPEPPFDWPERPDPLQILDQGWTYNPERRLMECYDVPLCWRAGEPRCKAVVELPLSRPPEYQLSGGPLHVKGQLVVETERLLSGLHVVWLDESERKTSHSEEIVSRQTQVRVTFEVDLEAAFRHRTVWAHRRLLFEGILPSWERPSEVEHILSDVGLTVLANQEFTGGRTMVQATWREAGLPTRIFAVLQGRETTDQYTLTFDQERQRVQRNVRGGSLHLDLWAQGAGDPARILNKLDDIQIQLQGRWGRGDPSIWQGTSFKEA
jgi:hypothetical protein